MDFPKDLYVKTLDTGEEAYLGGAIVSSYTEVTYGRIMLYKAGSATGQFRLKIYADSARTEVVATSEYADLSTIEDFTVGDWIGKVRAEFATPYNLSVNHPVHITIETLDYTRNGNTDYLGVVVDWPFPVNTQTDSPKAGMLLELYGKEQ